MSLHICTIFSRTYHLCTYISRWVTSLQSPFLVKPWEVSPYTVPNPTNSIVIVSPKPLNWESSISNGWKFSLPAARSFWLGISLPKMKRFSPPSSPELSSWEFFVWPHVYQIARIQHKFSRHPTRPTIIPRFSSQSLWLFIPDWPHYHPERRRHGSRRAQNIDAVDEAIASPWGGVRWVNRGFVPRMPHGSSPPR